MPEDVDPLDMVADSKLPDPTARAAERLAFSVVLPLWMAAGSFDYVLHRRSLIERTSGTRESRLHAAGIALSAFPVLAGLLLEIDAGVLAVMAAGYVAHAGMSVLDIAYADNRRRIVPLEQHVHAMLELLPFTALSLVIVAHHDQALALVRRGRARARFALRRKRRPIPARALTVTIVACVAFVALPYAEELLRCMRYERARASRCDATAAADFYEAAVRDPVTSRCGGARPGDVAVRRCTEHARVFATEL